MLLLLFAGLAVITLMGALLPHLVLLAVVAGLLLWLMKLDRPSYTRARLNVGPAVFLALFLLVATSLRMASAQTPNYPPASPLQSSLARTPSAEYFPYFQVKVDKDNGFSTNQTVAEPVTNTYTASGAIAPTDHKSLLICATATCAMTLAAGTIDGYPIIIKRASTSAAVTVTASIDGSSQTITPGTAGVLRLRWDAVLATYDTE